ncbi:AAA family ATPase [Streptosporangiaceae bacterium NEAU-GS5]|nr:AAA family ATPase [Streptosporangiaceae bacterium NEAU-GS5]
MGTGELPPDRDPPVRAEVLRESETTRASRLFLAGRTVVRKEPLGQDADRRLRHELTILERLRGVAGVAQMVDEPRYAGSIVLADVGGPNLAQVVKPLAVDDLIPLALGLARAVARMHRQGVMHQDICPANILVSQDGAPCLVDFALATPWAEIRPEFTHHSEIVGTLAYLAPEQTGRTGRAVDQRADLYALGATLYELATGKPPFGSGDPLRLIHDHLARVPVAPAKVNPAVPEPLSAIVLHLLEKEPDNRYQTADGLVYDLEQVRDARTRPAGASARIGEHDVPQRLLPSSRPVGRDDEVGALLAVFEDALAGRGRAGRGRAMLVSGVPGVGKTTLVDQLRSAVTDSDGWFVAGKFDQYRRDLEFDAVHQAFRALGRLLLAEPEDELAELRGRILAAVGPNAGLVTATSPEFAALLTVPPDPGDPLTRHVRVPRAGVEVLRAVASRKRPVVMFVDDLQWAGRTPLGFVDLVLSEQPIDGLLLVGAYRDSDVDSAHPLAAPLSRWRDQAEVRHLRLDNLPVPSLVAMVAEMLHVDQTAAAGLAEVIEPYTSGNPLETVELLDALRRDEVLTATAAGWRWDAAAVRARLSRSEPAGLLSARVNAMSAPPREMVEAMACLGGRVDLSVLESAAGEPTGTVDRLLAPALEGGLLVGARGAVRFRHDRIREEVLRGLAPARRHAMHLSMARRLAAVPELFAVAAEQYLPVVDSVEDPAERRRAAALLRRAADQAALIGDYAVENALLTAALRLIDPSETATLVEVRIGRHAALYGLGRLEEADKEYRTIEELSTAADRVEATCVQVHGLTHRKRFAEAIRLGIDALGELGIDVPAADRLPAELEHRFDHLYRWLDSTEAADDQTRPEITDPVLLAASRLCIAILPATYAASDLAMHGWLSLEALRIRAEHGPSQTLVGAAAHAAFAAIPLRGDDSAAYRALRRSLALGEANGYEPDTSQARFLSAVLSWCFEPIEKGLQAAQQARKGLIACGDLANAGYTYYVTMAGLLDCAPTLDTCAEEVTAGLAFVRRTGSEQVAEALDSYRSLTGMLRGESSASAGDAIPPDRYADNPTALFLAHLTRAIAATVFGDPAGLARHTAEATPLLPAARGAYQTALARVLRGLALAGQARTPDRDERGALLAELDEVTQWLAARAADAPDNFLHLLRLLEAERAWAVGDFPAAVLAFDAARGEVARHRRPWHRAVITERAARFYLAHGVEHAGRDLLAQARLEYLAWGATAKVDQLDWAYPSLRPPTDATAGHGGGQPGALPHGRVAVSTGTIDLLGILSASQALSSETSIERLHARVVEVLSELTGATGVHLLVWSGDRQDWVPPAHEGAPVSAQVAGPGHERTVPRSVVRYVQRMGEPLIIGDATRDDRFARDPYFADVTCCSLLAVPILSRGTLRAVLLLENRLIRGAFTAERLDAVNLIAGQLAVSVDNVQLYAELTSSRARIVAAADQARRRIERDLHDGAQQRLVSLGLQLRMAQTAVPCELDELSGQLDRAAAEATGALDELREIARGLHPAILAEGGLRPALKALARRSPIPVDLDARVEGRLPEHIEVSAYYVVAEALTNAAKHARVPAVSVEVEVADAVLRVAVRDHGAGGADFTRGTGLVGLKDRVEALGGRMSLDSPRGAGTCLSAEFPLTAGTATSPR